MSAPHALLQMPHPILPPSHSNGEEKVLIIQMVKYWANFVRKK